MAQWKRDSAEDALVVAAGVPDSPAVFDAHGNLIGWDESPGCEYLSAHGMPCDADCQARGHINLIWRTDVRRIPAP